MTATCHCWNCGAVFAEDEAAVAVVAGEPELRCPACGSDEVEKLPAAEKPACECCGGEGVYCDAPCPRCGGETIEEVIA